MIKPHAAFDVQTTLAKVTRLRVDTRKLDGTEVLFTIGYKWDLVLEEEDLRSLYNATDCESQFRKIFEELKPRCLSYNAMKPSR